MDQTIKFFEDNHAVISGKIVNRHEQDNTVSFTIATHERGRGNKDYVDFPRIFFFKEDHPEVADFLLHDSVTIHAHATARTRSYKGKKSYIHQGLVGDCIEKAESSYQKYFGADIGSQTKDENIIRMHGTVTAVTSQQEGVVRLHLNVIRDRYVDNVMVVSFNAKDLLITPGETVTVYGKVSTRRKDTENGRRFYESIVISKIERENKGVAPEKTEEKKSKRLKRDIDTAKV